MLRADSIADWLAGRMAETAFPKDVLVKGKRVGAQDPDLERLRVFRSDVPASVL